MSVDLSRIDRMMLDKKIGHAQALQDAGLRDEAAAAWQAAAKQAETFAGTTATPHEKERRLRTAAEFRRLAEQLRTPVSRPSSQRIETADAPNEYREAARNLIISSDIRFDEIAGLEHTKQELLLAFALNLAVPPNGVVLPKTSNILMYGPPGCGKTLLAAAVSNGFQATFFNVKVGDLMSKYFGETSKLVQAVYDEARAHQNAVVFLDEFDAIAGLRDSSDSGTERRLLVSLLTELDGLREKDTESHVITIAATNHPWALDNAILSRFEKHILIPLPDLEARQRILELQLPEQGYRLEFSLEDLACQTDGLSGRELKSLCNLLKEDMIRQANRSLTELALQGEKALRACTVMVEPLRPDNLLRVRERVQPVTSAEDLKRFDQWRKTAIG